MTSPLSFATFVIATAGLVVFADAKPKKPDTAKIAAAATPAQEEEATRLQIFLDRANFGPGKIDGRGGEFTIKALARYREANGLPASAAGSKADVTGIDLTAIEPVFASYTITGSDMESVGELAKEPEAQAKLKSLPYGSMAEAVAEKFHCDLAFFKKLNPGAENLKEGDEVKVPNVEAFDLGAVKAIVPGAEADSADDEETAPEPEEEPKAENEKTTAKKTDDAKEEKETATKLNVQVLMKENMLEVRDDEKLVAAFPVTIGSGRTESPMGRWKVKGVAKLPEFRYDLKMLKKGERSSKFHMLPPGPNNPVGVIWIALNKKGIGIHGTNEPDSIGRASSHGCIRLANWDVTKLAGMIKGGCDVTIK